MGTARGGRRGSGIVGGADVETDVVGLTADWSELAGVEREGGRLEDSVQWAGAESEVDHGREGPGVVRGPGEGVDAVGPVAGVRVAGLDGLGGSRHSWWGEGVRSERIEWDPGGKSGVGGSA